jgi:putative ABC transport system permease protein
MGIPVVRGREFSDQDAAGAPPVVIVNDEFVRRYFPNEDAIGKQLFPWTEKAATIVGVARSVRQVSLDQAPRPELYVAAAQTPAICATSHMSCARRRIRNRSCRRSASHCATSLPISRSSS